MGKIVIILPDRLNQHIDNLAEVKRKSIASGKFTVKPPISQLDWLQNTPEGRRFTNDCMQHKYARLNQTKLNELALELYYETYDLVAPHKSRKIKQVVPSFPEVRSGIVTELLNKALGFSTMPVLTEYNNIE